MFRRYINCEDYDTMMVERCRLQEMGIKVPDEACRRNLSSAAYPYQLWLKLTFKQLSVLNKMKDLVLWHFKY